MFNPVANGRVADACAVSTECCIIAKTPCAYLHICADCMSQYLSQTNLEGGTSSLLRQKAITPPSSKNPGNVLEYLIPKFLIPECVKEC